MITNIDYVLKNLPRHSDDAHKGDRGRVLIIGGSVGLTGAMCMASNAALRAGAGLITAAVPDSLNHIFETKLTEVMTLPLKDNNGEISVECAKDVLKFALKCDAVAIGPGLGVSEGGRSVLDLLLCEYSKKLIIDADALNILSKDVSAFGKSSADILLTPHVGEMSRLCGKSSEEISRNRESVALDFAKKHNVSVLLKGKDTVITDGNEIFVNPTGNNGMAKGGSGDVLTGVCVSLAAQGVSAFKSGVLGAYIHGAAGDLAKDKFTEYAITPCDIINNLADAFKKISEN